MEKLSSKLEPPWEANNGKENSDQTLDSFIFGLLSWPQEVLPL